MQQRGRTDWKSISGMAAVVVALGLGVGNYAVREISAEIADQGADAETARGYEATIAELRVELLRAETGGAAARQDARLLHLDAEAVRVDERLRRVEEVQREIRGVLSRGVLLQGGGN